MKYKRFQDTIVVRLETGEEIHQSIRQICRREQVALGSISGFGGIRRLKVGIWNNPAGCYDYLEESEKSMELLSLTGNITMQNEEVTTHIHVAAADNDFRVFGGHLVTGEVQNLAELMIRIVPGKVERIPFENWYVMDLEEEA